jgi:hypothetical protein
MIDGNALAEYYLQRFQTILIFFLLLSILCCTGGWWTGDRYDLPTIEVHAR